MPIQTAADSISNSAGSPYGFKNRIINGAMAIDQRNAGGSVTYTAAGTSGGFHIDRYTFNNTATSGNTTCQQSSTAPTGFTKSFYCLNNAAGTATTTQKVRIYQPIEGYNVADLGWGASGASSVTLSFWVRSSIIGTYAGALINENVDRSYVFTYTINVANTWEYKTVTIPGDTSGTWPTINGVGIYVMWDLGSGSSMNGTANTWSSSYIHRTSGSTNWVATSGATFYITGVQLEKGTQATAFDYRPYGAEFALCQRYFEISGATTNSLLFQGYVGSASAIRCPLFYNVTKRVQPTVTVVPSAASWTYSNGSGLFVANAGVDTTRMEWNTAGAGMSYAHNASGGTYLTISAEL